MTLETTTPEELRAEAELIRSRLLEGAGTREGRDKACDDIALKNVEIAVLLGLPSVDINPHGYPELVPDLGYCSDCGDNYAVCICSPGREGRAAAYTRVGLVPPVILCDACGPGVPLEQCTCPQTPEDPRW